MSDGAFTQDKVRPLGGLISASSPDEIRRYLDAFAELNLLCWRYGVFVRLFNFADHSGFDANGRLVMIDFGESSFFTPLVSGFVASMIESGNWGDPIHLERHLPTEFHDHYRRVMHSRLGTGNFELLWGSALGELDKIVIAGPPLCERKDELPKLTQRLLERAIHETENTVNGVSPEVMSLFYQYHWPGSVCELDNVLHQAVAKSGLVLKRSEVIQLRDIQMSPFLKWVLGKL